MFSKIKGNGHFIVRIEVNQFGAAFMGLILTLATSAIADWLFLLASIFTSIFYLSLLYTAFWDLGAKEAVRIQGDRATEQPLAGLGLSLVANLPNILLGIVILVSAVFAKEVTVAEGVITQNFASQLHAVAAIVDRCWNSMYWGVFYTLKYPDFLYLLSVIPALAVSALGYFAGLRSFRLLQFLHLAPKKKTSKIATKETRL